MPDSGAGLIILVASKAGVPVDCASYAYGGSRGGDQGLALTLDRHLGHGIRVKDLCPGGEPAAAERILGRLTSPGTVAELLAFFASPAAHAMRRTIFMS
jgi:NAD(P)-dependent dehydrogenase (short-subunit alcohol dehydrogenase family)